MTITGHDESDSQGNDELYRRIHAYACDTENFWPEIRALINGIPEAIPRLQAAGKLHAVEEFSFVSDVPGKNESPGFTGGGKSTDALLQLVQQAKESVMIQSPYLVLTEMGLDLFQAAVERGVDVTILTNSLSSTDNLEAFNGYQRIRSELLAAGVHVYEYRPDAAIRKRLITAEKQKEIDTEAKRLTRFGRDRRVGSARIAGRKERRNGSGRSRGIHRRRRCGGTCRARRACWVKGWVESWSHGRGQGRRTNLN